MLKAAYRKAAVAAAAGLGFAILSVAGASAQQTAAAGTPASDYLSKADVAKFSNMYNVPVEVASTPASPKSIDSAPPTYRLRDLQKLAASTDTTWLKYYRVSPASSTMPVTTLADAQQMTDQSGLVSLDISGMPAAKVMRTIAAADSAAVKFPAGAASAPINVAIANAPVADAIAVIAQRTHTHWQPVYELAPVAGVTPTPSEVAFAPKLNPTYQEYEETQLFNGPVNIQVANPSVSTPPAMAAARPGKAAVAAASNANAAAANANDAAANANAAAANASNASGVYPAAQGGYPPGYAPAYGYAPQPSAVQIQPGIVATPGGPYGGSTIIFGGTSE